jgi:predicted dithiol-disulfide oxidoreductase (DUF899 family)
LTFIEVVSADQWKAARAAVREQEAAAVKARAAANAARRDLPAVMVDKEYVFEGPTGKVTLLEAFEGRRQLIVYHFMFQPSWDEGCPYCSHIIDQVGHPAHVHALDTTFAVVSTAPSAKIEPFRQRMGWDLPWYSVGDSGFSEDFHGPAGGTERGALTVLLRDGERIYHTYSAFDDEIDLDMLDSTYVDLTPLGLSHAQPWPKHHDKYGA